MQIVILKDADQVASYSANIFIQQLANRPDSVLGLATGSTPLSMYRKLIEANREGKMSLRQATTFNLDEYLGLAGDHPQSYRHFMNQHLFSQTDIELGNTHIPNGIADNPIGACQDYEAAIADCGGIDLQLLGIGRNGHIGFNEPSSGLSSRTRIKTLTPATIADNARFFADDEFQPHLSITMGIGTILDSHKLVLLATGSHKAQAVHATIEGPLTAACPASALQLHHNTIIVIDEAAASKLEQADFYKHIEVENHKLRENLGLAVFN